MPETDRLRSRNGGSAKQQGGGSRATKNSGGLEQGSGPCEVHKLPIEEGGDILYTLKGAGKRCNCKLDVEDYVVTVHGWPCSEDVRLCPKHFVQLYKRGDLLRVETIAECDSRLRQEEGAGAQAEQQSARASVRASPQSSARSAASTSSLSFAGVQAADSVEEWDARGYPVRGVDRVGTPYGAAGQLVGGAAAEGAAAENQSGRFASLRCSAQLCCDTLGMKVEGTHDVFWLAKCTGWSLVSTPEAPVLEMYVVSCGRAVSVSVDAVSNRTGAWQLQWLDDSLVGSAQDGAPEFDGCDAAGTTWSELKGGSEWGEMVSPLDMELQYQQRGMPAVGVARGVGVGPGQGITGASVPRTPISAVQRLEQRVAEQSPPSVGSPEWSRGAAQEKRQQQERARDDEALREAASRPGRGSSSSSSSNSSGSYVRSSSSSSSSGGEVMQGRVESKHTRQKAAAARATTTAAGLSSGASGGPDGSDSALLSEDVMHQLRPAGTPVRLSYLEKVKMSPRVGATQAAAARSSPGWEDSSVLEGSLKTHQAAPGEGKSVHPNVNVSPLPHQSVDLQTVDRLHVSDAAAGGGVALNAHSKGLHSTVGLNSIGVTPAVVLQPSRNDIHKSGQLLAVEAESATVSSVHTPAKTPMNTAVSTVDHSDSTGVTPAVVLQPSRNDIHKSGQLLAVEAESATVSSVYTPARTPVNTAVSTVDHSERQLLQLQQQHGTVQSHPLTQGGPAQTSGGGDAVGVLQQNSTVQNRTDLTDHTDHGRQTVSGRPGVDTLSERAQSSCQPTSSNVATVFANSVGAPGPDSCGVLGENQSGYERQSDQNLLPVSPLGDAEYDAHLRLSAGQRVQLVQQSLPASPLGPLRGDRHLRLRSRSSMGDAVTAPESEDKSNGLPSPSSGRSADAQSVPVQDRTARYSTVRYSKVPEGVTDSTPESRGSGSDSEESVSGGGGCVDTDRTVPLTSDVSVESEPTCKTSLVPAVGTNGMCWPVGCLESWLKECLGSGGSCRASGRVFRGSMGNQA